MIFKIQSHENKLIKNKYDKAMQELDDFFDIRWKKNQPRIYLVKDGETATKWWDRGSDVKSQGWINGSDIYILERSALDKYRSQKYPDSKKYSNKEYFMLIKHELAHVFTRVSINFFNNQQLSPDWLWEGVATYLSGMNVKYKRPVKLKNFLKYNIKDMGNGKVYEESGYAIEFLVEQYGKEKLLELIEFFKEPYSEKAFAKRFKKIYGLELNYDNFHNS